MALEEGRGTVLKVALSSWSPVTFPFHVKPDMEAFFLLCSPAQTTLRDFLVLFLSLVSQKWNPIYE